MRKMFIAAVVAFLAACGTSTEAPTLDEKLAHQFKRYEEARELLLERVVVEHSRVGRTEFDQWITPTSAFQMTSEDIAELRAEQSRVIAEARARAVAKSTFDLNAIRDDAPRLQAYCSQMPKGGLLHLHPAGTRTVPVATALITKFNPEVDPSALLAALNDGVRTELFPSEIAFLEGLKPGRYSTYTPDEQEQIVGLMFLPDEPPTSPFPRFSATFRAMFLLLHADRSNDAFVSETTYKDFLRRAEGYNVSYVEFTDGMDPTPETFAPLAPQAERFLHDYGIVARWNDAFARSGDVDQNAQRAQQLIELMSTHQYPEVVGIDLLSNETHTPALETGQLIYMPLLAANRSGAVELKRTMHAGELGYLHNARDAMIMGANRIGHGVSLRDDPVALEYARLLYQLPIEINVVSNYRLRVVSSYREHPFLDFLRLGLPVSLSTDDEGIFKSDIATDCVKAVGFSDVTHHEMRTMSYNAIEQSFTTDEQKAELLTQLDLAFEHFESNWVAP